MDCIKCNSEINPLRLKALPNTRVCVNCSSESALSGFMSFDHKTAPTLNICSSETLEKINAMSKRKGTGVLTYMKSDDGN